MTFNTISYTFIVVRKKYVLIFGGYIDLYGQYIQYLGIKYPLEDLLHLKSGQILLSLNFDCFFL